MRTEGGATGVPVGVAVKAGASVGVAVAVAVDVAVGISTSTTWNSWLVAYSYPLSAMSLTVTAYLLAWQEGSIWPGTET